MSFNGSGTFLINTAGQPVVSGTVISSTAFNALTADLATGLSTAITKDGQTTVTANIPMSTYKFTGLGVGSAATDSANLSQVQSTVTKLLTSVSGADTITAVGAPVVSAYAAGQMFYFVATGDNTGAVTLNIDALGAKAVTRDGSVALAAGDIKSGEVVVVVYDGTRFQVVSQLNSAGNATFANVSITSALNVGGVATFTANPVLNGGTANGVLYLNGSKVATSGTALTFDGTKLVASGGNEAIRIASGAPYYSFYNAAQSTQLGYIQHTGTDLALVNVQNGTMPFYVNNAEGMRLTSTGLGIGTSSPAYKLDVQGASGVGMQIYETSTGNNNRLIITQTGTVSRFTSTYSSGSANFAWNIGGGEVMRLDSSGNLGLGVTPSAWQSGVKAFQNGAGALYTINTVQQRLSLNAYRDSAGTMRYINSSINAAEFRMGEGDGSFQFHTAASGTAGNTISFTQAMTLTAAGDLGIGTTSPAGRLDIRASGAVQQYIISTSATSQENVIVSLANNGAVYSSMNFDSADYKFKTSGNERARITAAGELLVGTTTSAGYRFRVYDGISQFTQATSATDCADFWNRATTGDNKFVAFYTETSATSRGSITYNRGAGQVAYNITSDVRLKDNIANAADSGDKVDAIKVRQFDWKETGNHVDYGFVAQELNEVAPHSVTKPEDDESMWSVDYSKLVPMLVKEIQSLRARVAQLETK